MLHTQKFTEKIVASREETIKKFMFFFTYINGVVDIFIVDERKAPWPPSLVVVDHLDLLNWTVLWEQLPDLLLTSVQTQTKYTDHPAWAGVELRSKRRHTGYNARLLLANFTAIQGSQSLQNLVAISQR